MRNRRARFFSGLAVLVLCAIGSGLAEPALASDLPGTAREPKGHAQAPQARVEVSRVGFGESEQTACRRDRARDFALEELRDLYLCVAWRGLSGTHVEQLTLRTPDGAVYQTLTVPFTTPGAPTPADAVEVEGRRHEVQHSGRSPRGETLVLAVLPVAGTFITQYHLVGLWTVEVSLNGRLIATDQFSLTAQD